MGSHHWYGEKLAWRCSRCKYCTAVKLRGKVNSFLERYRTLRFVRMKIILICCLLLQIHGAIVEDTNEKIIKVWEDRIQHAALDADEVNFPLFIEDNVQDVGADDVKLTMEDNVTEATTYQETQTNEFIFPEIHEINEKHNNSIITFFHKITTNNVTRHGVTTIPSSSLVPLLKTALGSLSGESALILGLGGLLPLLMMSLPLVVMMIVMPVIFIIISTMFGILASGMVFVPLVIFAIGISSVTDFQFLDKMSDFDEFSSFENFPSLEEIERIDEIINMDMENITNFGEESIKMNNNNVPRSLY